MTVGNVYHNTCKNGEGECELGIGDLEAMKKFLEKHHLDGRDLVVEATNLVHIEAVAHPDTVGGTINQLLIDSTGTHRINNTRPGCPVSYRNPQREAKINGVGVYKEPNLLKISGSLSCQRSEVLLERVVSNGLPNDQASMRK